MIPTLALRAAQTAYDFCLDLTGVRIGTYRAVLLLTPRIVVCGALSIATGNLFYAAIGIPYAALSWRTSSIRARCDLDDADQAASRLKAVNARALGCHRLLRPLCAALLVIVAVTLCVPIVSLKILMGSWGLAGFVCCVNECVLVRGRDESRFRSKRLSPAMGAAA